MSSGSYSPDEIVPTAREKIVASVVSVAVRAYRLQTEVITFVRSLLSKEIYLKGRFFVSPVGTLKSLTLKYVLIQRNTKCPDCILLCKAAAKF